MTGVGLTRLKNIARKLNASKPIEDKRGGDRKSHASLSKKGNVRAFIRNLRGTESHYNRLKSRRIYLSCDLSIKKLRDMYNDTASEDMKVNPAMFRRIFVQEFNIGFRSPASDACSTCCLLPEKLKGHNQDQMKK